MATKKKVGIAVITMLCVCALISGGMFIHQYTDAKKSTEAYNTGYTAEYGDELITLSTCEYTHNNGRFVVVAKKL